MAKLAQTSVKYLVKASFNADGVVEKPDVIGALFGQTEGLLGPDLDLRELQQTGRIGRIEVSLKSKEGKTEGEVILPSSLDSTETALVAAALETIERVGPCMTKIKILGIEDLRAHKREYMVGRAKELLGGMLSELPETPELTEELMQSVRSSEVTEFKGLAAGPEVLDSDAIILVEGRADVVNLLKHGVKNVVSIGGTKVPPTIVDISKEKDVTVFLDGDRGGDLILKELIQVGVAIDFMTRAPEGKEVEELTKKEIFKALRDKVPFEHSADSKQKAEGEAYDRYDRNSGMTRRTSSPRFAAETAQSTQPKPYSRQTKRINEELKSFFKVQLDELIGTKAASLFDKDMKFVGRVPLRELRRSIRQVNKPGAIIVDGVVDRDLLNLAEAVGVSYLIGSTAEKKESRSVVILSADDF